MDQSSLLLFHKIHCGAVSIEKDKYITPAYSLKNYLVITKCSIPQTSDIQWCPEEFFFPLNYSTLEFSLSPSVANIQSTEEFNFRALLN